MTLKQIKKICAIEPFLLQAKEIMEAKRKESEREGKKRKGNMEEAEEGENERNRSNKS